MKKHGDKRFSPLKTASKVKHKFGTKVNQTKLKSEEMLRTKSADKKMVPCVTLKLYSERTTQQKKLGIILSGVYLIYCC